MSITIETKQNQDGSFSPTTIENQYELKQLVNHGIQLIGVLQIIGNEVVNLTTGLNQAIINNENAIQIYWHFLRLMLQRYNLDSDVNPVLFLSTYLLM